MFNCCLTPLNISQSNFSICETASSLNLTANPTGGSWAGTGITNPNNGTFSPNGLAGVYTVTYGFGGCSDDLDITVKTDEKIRITLKGTIQQFKSVKKTSVFTKLLDQGIKISFKTEEEDVPEYSDTNKANVSFTKTLDDLVKENKDTFLTEAYEYVLHDRNILSDDIFFL
jgi:hypothetical protein